MRIIQEVEPARGILDIVKMNVQIKSSKSNNLDGDKGKQSNYDNNVDFQYICIKKEYFDVNLIYIKYTNLKKENYMEIIYKSPSIFLDGLFFKTPPLNISQLSIFTKDRMPFTSVITSILDMNLNSEFINMLKSIDSYLSNYIISHARDINIKMNEDENHYLNYEPILKPWHYSYSNKKKGAREQLQYSAIVEENKILNNNIPLLGNRSSNNNSISNSNSNSNIKKWVSNYVINFKSYLERSVLEDLKQSILDRNKNQDGIDSPEKKYILTFNISNIYFSKTVLAPLIKCNKCQEVI
jgi:hypothetical protein